MAAHPNELVSPGSLTAPALVLLAAVCACVLAACGGSDARKPSDASSSASGLSQAAVGQKLFGANCAPCHGLDLRGTSMGPPLLNPMYAPSRVSDQALYDAVTRGVAQKNWKLGSMPAIPSLSKSQVADIVAYVRSQQDKAGLT